MAGIISENADQRIYALQLAGDFLRAQSAEPLKAEPLKAEPLKAEPLKQFLFNALQQEKGLHRISGLIWALGKSRDPQFIELYRDFLRKFSSDLPAASGELYQTLIALDNCGEPVFGRDGNGRSSRSILDVERNWRQGKAYLEEHKAEAACLDAAPAFSV